MDANKNIAEIAYKWADLLFAESGYLINRPWPEWMMRLRDSHLSAVEEAVGLQWHDPKVDLPEFGTHCIVLYKIRASTVFSGDSGFQVVEYCKPGFFNPAVLNVIAWMPIPPLPKEIITK